MVEWGISTKIKYCPTDKPCDSRRPYADTCLEKKAEGENCVFKEIRLYEIWK